MKITKTLMAVTVILGGFTVFGCGGGGGGSSVTPTPVDPATAILHQLNGWASGINQRNTTLMGAYYSPRYLQDGSNRQEELSFWEELFLLSNSFYLEILIDQSHLNNGRLENLSGDFATAIYDFCLRVHYRDPNGVWHVDESDESLTFEMHRENGRWLIYGNQQEAPGLNLPAAPVLYQRLQQRYAGRIGSPD